ncbi:MAG: SulP family inorganic anion transporter [Roseiarcus sp.]
MTHSLISPRSRSRLVGIFPFLVWLPKTNRETLFADFLAGLTGAIVVLPQGVAFATIAGMPPQYGLYAGIVPTLVAALFGSSWHLVAGPSTTASLILFASLSAFAEPGSARYVELALTLAAMVGLLELSLGVFKLGMVVNFISHSVVVGYTAGVGVLIIASQARNFFGVPIPRSAEFFDVIVNTLAHLPALSWPTTLVAFATLTTGIATRRFLPRVPFMILAIVVGGLVAVAFNLWRPGSVTTVGALPSHLPPLSAPSFDPDTWRLLIPTALAVAISALNEVVSISRALAIRSEQHLNINQEFIGQGLANAIGCFFSGYVVSGSFNRSALNYDAGGRTPMAALFAAALLAILLVVAAPLAAYLPHAAMAASLVLVGWGLIDRRSIVRIARTSRTEVAVLLVTILTALFVQIQMGILVGVALSLLIYLYRTSNPHLRPRVPDPSSSGRKFTDPGPGLPECPQLRLFRLDGSLFFGAVSSFRDALREIEAHSPDCKHIVVIMSGVNFVDVAGAEALAIEARRMRNRGGDLFFIRVKERVLELLERGGYLGEIGADNVFQSKTRALRTIYRRLDYDICRRCDRRVFVECARMGKQEPIEDDDAEAQDATAPIARPSAAPNG